MAYESKYQDEKDEFLRPYFEMITNLKTGSSLTLRARSQLIPSIRYRIYNWLHHSGLKKHFKVYTENDKLVIRRVGGKPYISATVEGQNELLDEVIRKMILAPDEAGAQEVLQSAVEEGQVSPADLHKYLVKWKEITQGTVETLSQTEDLPDDWRPKK